ncbi:tRNA (guanine-N(7)-)-methyltransferase [Paraliobacillus ryukyuensis]|uniref:tRNA (guanine-N(7)-)-methyltransferase n=1 Tax=Paraliobacillus ryukyuensis TaxID=200904 RepID=A0A366ECX4_9BACI|nr:tRNA (guanosine(46)-N7)-methyltransferase TrmB [Paraliobacillus ryukyuensis]RBO99344.1 tRNA (guanine-N(7)-)-methyltransferase [Paraliobacillus ryukyuensis]
MRARYKPWADDYLKENNNIVVPNPSDYKGDWQAKFTNHAPIHLEIGTGKGQFIMGMAQQFPNVNFIGIEVVQSILVSAVQKVVEEQPGNVCFISDDADNVTDIFGENEVDKIYLNFSDPWPKNKHAKRRLTYKTFLEQYQSILKPGGEIVLKTDNMHLFEYSLVSFSQFGMELEEVVLDLHEFNDPTNIMTEYEEKFSAKGQPIYRCRATFV